MWEDRRLRDIAEADVRQIIDAQLEEHLQLEYKSALYENNERGHKEFLQDICMFANAGGGILLIGISEQRDDSGQPTGLPDPAAQLGIDIPNPEGVLQGYDARVVASIDERLPLESYPIPVANADNRYVIAMRVPNSLSKPHRVHYQGRTYFPSRRERHRYEMDVREIKEMVMRTASRLEESERTLKAALQNLVRQYGFHDLVIGSLPVFQQNFMLDIRAPEVLEAVSRFHLGNGNRVQPEFTFDGLRRQIRGEQHSFVQIRRDGLIATNVQLPITMNGNLYQFRPTAIDIFLRSFVQCSSQVYSTASINGPFLLSICLRTVGNTQSLYPAVVPPGEDENGGQIGQGIFDFPVVEADNLVEIDRAIRPLCDQAHQMFGRRSSPNFNRDGVWNRRDH
jgi:hypothetical protein